MGMPERYTRDWEDMLLGVLHTPPAHDKEWTAVFAEMREGEDMRGRERVIKQMIEHGRKFREKKCAGGQ